MEEKILFKYVFDENYKPDFVNGVYGGINTDGKIVAHFYCERFPLPYELEASIDEEGVLSPDVTVTKPTDHKIVRQIQSGIIIDKDFAVSFYKWLGEYLETIGVENDELCNDE